MTNILEIGSGNTPQSKHLREAIHFDIDKNAHCIECQGDCHKLPFTDKSFDTIYISHVIEHCNNPIAVLNELKRVAKNKIILKVPNEKYFEGFTEYRYHLYGWTPYTFSNLLRHVFTDAPSIRTNHNIRRSGNNPIVVWYYFANALKSLFSGAKNEIIAEIDLKET